MSNHRRVVQAIEDRFLEEERLSDKSDIAEWTGLTTGKIDDTIEDLAGNGLVTIYDKTGVTTLYLTQDMFNAINAKAGEPEWLTEYEFDEKASLREEIEEANNKIADYQMIERLLYSSGIPLEESVEHGLEILGFDPDTTENEEDFKITQDNSVYIIEVKGISGKINKSHVNQLDGWLNKQLSNSVDPENLTGLLVHNHQRHEDPSERDYPLTDEAERFLKFNHSKHVHTQTLFRLVKSVEEGEIEQSEAREQFLEGDEYDN